jgi:hypothetical protein
MKSLAISLIILASGWTSHAAADWTEARCDIYPKGEDQLLEMVPCTFGQRQGAVTITLPDNVSYDLQPVGDDPGNYHDQNGEPAYRQSGLGDEGLIFRLKDISIFVYWDTSALNPEYNPDMPYSTKDYDATTLLRCGMTSSSEMETCPAGIMRMEDNQASITVTSPAGNQFTINFMTDYVNATSGEVDARMEGDTWIVIVNGKEQYEVPLAAIEGG